MDGITPGRVPCLLVVLLVVALPGASLADVFSAAQEQQVRDFVQAAMDCFNTTGLTVAVVKGNQSWTRGFGLADVERGVNVTSSTLFVIASISKAFTSTLLALAINGTQYTWQTPLREILGEEFHLATEQLTRETTLRDILSHRTGLTPANLPVYGSVFRDLDRSDFLKRLRFLEPKLLFRDDYLYNNWMYGLAGHVASRLLGQSWEEALRTRLFQPLGMRSSRVLGHTVETSDDVMAKPYFLQDGQLKMIDSSVFSLYPMESAGGIASSADDMSHWMRFLLREGKTESGQSLVEEHLLRDCFRSVVAINNGDMYATRQWLPQFPVTLVDMSYGFAWFNTLYRGRRAYWHGGGFYSYLSTLMLFPDLDVAVFTSQSGAYMQAVSKEVALFLSDLLMGEAPQKTPASICSSGQPRYRADNVTTGASKYQASDDILDDVISGSLAPYLGVYRHPFAGDVSVVPNAAEDGLAVEYGQLTGRLNRTSQAASFRLLFTGPLAFLGIGPAPGVTISLPVRFLDLEAGRYQTVNVTDVLSMDSFAFERLEGM